MSELYKCGLCGELRYGHGQGSHVETGETECAATMPRLAGRLVDGVYQPGQYARADDMGTGPVTTHDDGSMSFEVYTAKPNADRETLTVTIRPERPHICGSTVNLTSKPCPQCGAIGAL